MTKRVLGIGLILSLFIPLAAVPAQATQIQLGFEFYGGSGFSTSDQTIVEAAIAANDFYVTLSDASTSQATLKFVNTNSQFSITGIYIDTGANSLFTGFSAQTGGQGSYSSNSPGATFPGTLTPAFTTDYSVTTSGNGIDKANEYVSIGLAYQKKKRTPLYTLDDVIAQLVSDDLRVAIRLTMTDGDWGTLLMDPPKPPTSENPVPEPSTITLLGLGLFGSGLLGWRRRK